jgi:uncharacterized Zn-binding protein involved in type VI secretion
MGQPAVVANDHVVGQCMGHQIPSPTGNPIPAPPLPFSAPLTTGLATTVFIGGKPAAVAGASGMNQPPHVGLHPSDSFLAPPSQLGQVAAGSGTVMFNQRPAAYTGCQVTACFSAPAMITGSATTVLIGA